MNAPDAAQPAAGGSAGAASAERGEGAEPEP